jgi:hypothetical protein
MTGDLIEDRWVGPRSRSKIVGAIFAAAAYQHRASLQLSQQFRIEQPVVEARSRRITKAAYSLIPALKSSDLTFMAVFAAFDPLSAGVGC